jgi:pimeloyl-ACP methyl ester carboxylesterase
MNIFLIRGLVREKQHWGTFPQQLEHAFGVNVYTPEIQGVGENWQQTSPDNFDEMVEFMRSQYLDQIMDGNNMVIAISMGGMIARLWMEKYPNDFKHVVLVNTSFKGINPLFHRLRPHSVFRFLNILTKRSLEERERRIVNMVVNTADKREGILKNWIEIQKKHPVKMKSFINQIKAALTFNPPMDKPQNNHLLILAAKKDLLCHYKCSEKMHQTWGGKLKIHPEAGHDLPADAPEWMINSIKEWMQEKTNA